MDVGATVVANTQPPELVQPTDGSFHDPSALAQAAAVLGVSGGDRRGNAAGPKGHSMRVRVVGPIRIQEIRPAARTTGTARY